MPGVFSNYCGVGPFQSGPARHALDELCRIHDEDYAEIIATHGYKAAYWHFNDADKKFLDGLKSLGQSSGIGESALRLVSQRFFELKNSFSGRSHSEIESVTNMPKTSRQKRLREIRDLNPLGTSSHTKYRDTGTGRQRTDNHPGLGNPGEYVVTDNGRQRTTGYSELDRYIDVMSNGSVRNSSSNVNMDSNNENNEAESARAFASSSSSGGGSKGRGETKLTPLPNHITFHWPEVFTTKLPIVHWESTQYADLADSTAAYDFVIATNNPLDFSPTLSGTNNVLGWTKFSSIYRYYCVVGMEYRVIYSIQNPQIGATSGPDFEVFMYKYGAVTLPSHSLSPWRLRSLPDVQARRLEFTRNVRDEAVFEGFLTHDDWPHEIDQDATDNRWTAVANAPARTQNIRFMPRRDLFSSIAANHTVNDILTRKVELVYHVQFKQLVDTEKYVY